MARLQRGPSWSPCTGRKGLALAGTLVSHALAAAARELGTIDGGLVDAAEALVQERLHLFSRDPRVIVHTDMFGQNLLVERGRLTAVLDFEFARAAAADLELDVLLRFTTGGTCRLLRRRS